MKQKKTVMIAFSELEKHPDNGDLVPPLTSHEKEGLRESIRERGLEGIPFVVCDDMLGKQHLILDGNSRYDIVMEEYGGIEGNVVCIDRGRLSVKDQRTEIENASLRRRNLSREQKIEIARRQIARGVPQSEVAKTVGMSQQWVSNQAGDVSKGRKDAEFREAMRLRAMGYSTRQTAEQMGVAHSTVLRREKEVVHSTRNGKMHHPDEEPSTDSILDKAYSKLTSEEEKDYQACEEFENHVGYESPQRYEKPAAPSEIDPLDEEVILRRVEEKKRTAEVERRSKPVFNVTNDNVEWARYTWNPVKGCKHGCPYCYARDIAMRFDHTFEPQFFEERLVAPLNTRLPVAGINKVFVCSMADLFGDWVPDEWIERILDVVRDQKQWTYLFLTKNPSRYSEIDWPSNTWVGATVDTQARVQVTEDALRRVNAPVKFVSCEPLLEEVIFSDMSVIDWIIIGGKSRNTQGRAEQPEWRWVENLLMQARDAEIKVYFKPNLTVVPKEYPH